MEAHLESCQECRTVLAEYAYLGEHLSGVPEEAILAAQERVWKNLTAPELVMPGTEGRRVKAKTGTRNWSWNITLPLPVAAAAVLVIIASLALVGISTLNRSPGQIPVAAADIGLDDQGILPVNDISGVIQFLSSQGHGDFMVIRLPESPRFSRAGEPVLINAADYSRRTTFR
jgi:hypothetical protein